MLVCGLKIFLFPTIIVVLTISIIAIIIIKIVKILKLDTIFSPAQTFRLIILIIIEVWG